MFGMIVGILFGVYVIAAVINVAGVIIGAVLSGIGSVIGGIFSGLSSLASAVFSGSGLVIGIVIGLAVFYYFRSRNERTAAGAEAEEN